MLLQPPDAVLLRIDLKAAANLFRKRLSALATGVRRHYELEVQRAV